MGRKIKMASPRLELGTFSVLDWRDNQLHHETMLLRFDIKHDIN